MTGTGAGPDAGAVPDPAAQQLAGTGPTLYLIAGEPSGDRLGAALMAGLGMLAPGVRFHGVGGPAMQAQGLVSQFPMHEISLMGIAEVLPKYFALKRRIAECAAAVAALGPDALITIDSPDFCLRVARLAKAAGPLRTIHYVAPSVWAWRPGRAAKMAGVIDHVLALLPFEPPYMTAAGMGCTFVGHPVVAEPQAGRSEAAAFRLEHGLSRDAPVILVLPGSRRGEVARLAPQFGETLARVVPSFPAARVVIPTVAAVADLVRDAVRGWPGEPLVLAPKYAGGDSGGGSGGDAAGDAASDAASDASRKRAAFAAASVALAASGTVSLELAASRTPMVIGYDMAWLSRQIIGRLLKVDTVTLVNLVSETRTVPEFLGRDCRADRMAPALTRLLQGGPERDAQLAAMELTMTRLGQGGEDPGLRAARAVLGVLAGEA